MMVLVPTIQFKGKKNLCRQVGKEMLVTPNWLMVKKNQPNKG